MYMKWAIHEGVSNSYITRLQVIYNHRARGPYARGRGDYKSDTARLGVS